MRRSRTRSSRSAGKKVRKSEDKKEVYVFDSFKPYMLTWSII